MSTYWGYKCETCDVASTRPINREYGALVELVQNWPIVKALLSTSHLQVRICGLGTGSGMQFSLHREESGRLIEFLREHEGHEIYPVNDYGDTIQSVRRKRFIEAVGE